MHAIGAYLGLQLEYQHLEQAKYELQIQDISQLLKHEQILGEFIGHQPCSCA